MALSQINNYIAPHFIKPFLTNNIYILTPVISFYQSSGEHKNYCVIPFNNHCAGLSVLRYPIELPYKTINCTPFTLAQITSAHLLIYAYSFLHYLAVIRFVLAVHSCKVQWDWDNAAVILCFDISE